MGFPNKHLKIILSYKDIEPAYSIDVALSIPKIYDIPMFCRFPILMAPSETKYTSWI